MGRLPKPFILFRRVNRLKSRNENLETPTTKKTRLKNSSVVYWVRWKDAATGAIIGQESTGQTNRDAALLWAQKKYEAGLTGKQAREIEKTTIKDITARLFLPNGPRVSIGTKKREKDKRDTTNGLYRSYLVNHVWPRFGESFVNKIKPADIDTWLQELGNPEPDNTGKIKKASHPAH